MILRQIGLTFFIFSMAACSSSSKSTQVHRSYTKVVRANFDQTWRASQQAFIRYPLKVNNMDTGTLETSTIRGSAAFKPSQSKTPLSSGSEYDILLRVVSVNDSKDNPRTKISITKELFNKRDFFSKPEPLKTDGLEEKTLIYRIKRELLIDELIEKLVD